MNLKQNLTDIKTVKVVMINCDVSYKTNLENKYTTETVELKWHFLNTISVSVKSIVNICLWVEYKQYYKRDETRYVVISGTDMQFVRYKVCHQK